MAEGFHHFPIGPGELAVGDRAYAKAKGLAGVVANGGHFLVRLGWRSVVLLNPQGQPFDLLAKLAELPRDQIHVLELQLANNARNRRPVCPVRLILSPLPPGAGERARQKAARKSKRQGRRRPLPQGAIAAEWLMLLTSLPGDLLLPSELTALYRLRWQIELAIKRLKSLMHLNQLPAKDHDLARCWIGAHILAALLINRMQRQADDSPP
jgi:hypothetical protein